MVVPGLRAGSDFVSSMAWDDGACSAVR